MAGDALQAADPLAAADAGGTIYEDAFGNHTITLADGSDLTIQLGAGFDTVLGADNADTIYGGTGGYDTIILGGDRESFYSSAEGATIKADAQFLGATIDGGGRSELDITAATSAAAASVTLGGNITGIAALQVAASGFTLDTGVLDPPFIDLRGSGDAITLRSAGQAIEDESGGNTIVFTAAGQTLTLPYADLPTGDPADPFGGETPDLLRGFAPGDTLDIALPYSTADTLAFEAGSGVLTLSEGPGNYTQTIDLLGSYAGTFRMQEASDAIAGLHGTDITYEPAEAPCFCEGSRILTPAGEVLVQHLRVGQRVLTASGAAVPIVWLGQRRIDCRRHPRPERVLPVRVREGAFGAGLPRRALLLSPDHAIAVDGVLIPVHHLLNGTTIVREAVDDVRYFHVELPAHDVLLAEGLPVESYLDTGNRAQFANSGAAVTLHADFAARGRRNGCARLVQDGPRLRRVQTRLAARARCLGFTATPSLRVFADGSELRPTRFASVCVTVLAADPQEVRLLAPPGAALRRIVLRDGRTSCTIGAEDPRLARSIGPIRRRGTAPARLIGAEAHLPPACWAGLRFPLLLELHLDPAA
ncbi:MAG: Hint domain-containing protein [Acidisphaera sp.]|nr:Hint domain-containing protein [Acidisphaera sp.]